MLEILEIKFKILVSLVHMYPDSLTQRNMKYMHTAATKKYLPDATTTEQNSWYF